MKTGPGSLDDDVLGLDRGANEDSGSERVAGPEAAGLGFGLDEAEKAQLQRDGD